MTQPVMIDIFAGAGGLSLGLENAGFDLLAAIESDPRHAATHRRNFPHCRLVEADVVSLAPEQLVAIVPELSGGLDLLAGGPPCQGFSVMGRRRAEDPRNDLLGEFARLVEELRPRAFLMENVPGLLSDRYGAIFAALCKRLRSAGYRVAEPLVLDARSFGVPQRRKRVFLLGVRGQAKMPGLPTITPEPPPTVWDAISDLPEVDDFPELDRCDEYAGDLGAPSAYADDLRFSEAAPLSGCLRPRHSPEVRARFAATAPGTREPISRFDRLRSDGVAVTLRAGTTREYGKHMAPRPIHPVTPRCITVREGARLHSFPDNFRFDPTRWHGSMEIGNAVPPKLAEALGRALLAAL